MRITAYVLHRKRRGEEGDQKEGEREGGRGHVGHR